MATSTTTNAYECGKAMTAYAFRVGADAAPGVRSTELQNLLNLYDDLCREEN